MYGTEPLYNEPRFNEPLYNELLGLTNDFHQPGQNYSKMCGTEPLDNEPRFYKYFSCFPQNSLNRGFRYTEHISPVPWHFVKLRFHCTRVRT